MTRCILSHFCHIVNTLCKIELQRKGNPLRLPLRHYFRYLLTGVCAGATGVSAVIFSDLDAHLSTMLADHGADLAGAGVQRRVAQHEVSRCQADLGAVKQDARIVRIAALLHRSRGRVQADCMTIEAVLNAVIDLIGEHRVICIPHGGSLLLLDILLSG